METTSRFSVDDLWSPGPDASLPGRATLLAIAQRCGRAWEMPHLAQRARIGYNARLRTTLGRAVLDERRVELNPRMLRRHPGELVPTLVHEIAHVAVHMRYGAVAPHGVQWRVLMRAVDMSARATHDLPTDGLTRRRRRYLYLHRCSDCGYTFVARKVRRDYYCVACGPDTPWDVFRVPNTLAGRELLASSRSGQASSAAVGGPEQA